MIKKEKKRIEERATLNTIDKSGYHTRHFRTRHNGNCTVLYRPTGDGYQYQVCYSFCSPKDVFSKKHGRLEAFKNHLFIMYLPPLKPHANRIRVQSQIDNMLLGFIKSISYRSDIHSNNRHDYEQYFGFPRWIKNFLNAYFNPWNGIYNSPNFLICQSNPNLSDDYLFKKLRDTSYRSW